MLSRQHSTRSAMVLAVAFIASLLLVAAAKPMDRRSMIVHERRDEPARGFVNSGVAPATKDLTLRIALKPNNIAGLETALYAVSDPASALYGQHLTQNEVCCAHVSSTYCVTDRMLSTRSPPSWHPPTKRCPS